MKIRFYAPQAGLLSFDWNRLGADSDSAYLSLWSDDPQASDRINDWIYAAGTFEGSFTQGGVDLCSRYYDVAPNPNCAYLNTQTGWSTKTVNVSQAGWYWIGFGVGEVAEGTTPTVLALDNLKFQVPEPSTLALLGIGIAAIGCGRRKRAANQGWL